MSAAAQPQSQVDFLKGEPHRKHPGVTNLKTLRLPEELQTAARLIITSGFSCDRGCRPSRQIFPSASLTKLLSNSRISPPVGAQVNRLTDRTRNLTNFLWSRKRAVEDVTLRKKAVSLEKELWEKAMEKRGGGRHTV